MQINELPPELFLFLSILYAFAALVWSFYKERRGKKRMPSWILDILAPILVLGMVQQFALTFALLEPLKESGWALQLAALFFTSLFILKVSEGLSKKRKTRNKIGETYFPFLIAWSGLAQIAILQAIGNAGMVEMLASIVLTLTGGYELVKIWTEE